MGTAMFLQNTSTSTTRAEIIAQYFAPAQLTRVSSSDSSEPESGIGLCIALELVDDCQNLLLLGHERRNNRIKAVVTFVKACAASIFCLDALNGNLKSLVLTLEELKEESKAMLEPLPDTQKAARLILFGYDLMPMDESDVLEALMYDRRPDISLTWSFWENMTEIDPEDLNWAYALGSYKAAHRMAQRCRPRRPGTRSAEFMDYLARAEDAWYTMDQLKKHHPLALHASVQLQMLQGNDAIPPAMGYGLYDSLYVHSDPASAMLYLLHIMYINMQEWVGEPSDHERVQLKHTATHVMLLRDHLMKPPHLWHFVKDKILASMLLLANRFPLAQTLGDHPLVRFIAEQHKQLRNVLLKQQQEVAAAAAAAAASELRQESQQKKDEAASLSPVKRNNEMEEDEENVPIGLRCTRCDKWIAKRHEKVKCPECKVAWYCGDECLIKHAQSHKAACRRAKLRSKLAAKNTSK